VGAGVVERRLLEVRGEILEPSAISRQEMNGCSHNAWSVSLYVENFACLEETGLLL
jgi:hypothetical protein